ncbi:YciI family protein [Nocardia blacklockiae]|uniref:YciI family protein n=1 Tax=Nocardia blacklockiae TaxID=480036 RepID=UPI001895DB16|nr:YciI family protein [Nocardia blacklockiae]MBF6175182.1 hypothetical protein [Nocardia blacklockiae]
MFVVILTYTADLDTIDALIPEHAAWLDANYAAGVFLASGRRVPRTGGVILADVGSRSELDAILAQDPFGTAGAATYEVIEFVPTKTAPALAHLARETP